jgi:hypothetical protein
VSELTFVTCPMCGLPAEFLLALDEAGPDAGPDAQGARIRCINMHVSIISSGDDPGESTGEPPPAVTVRHEVTADPVLVVPGPCRPSLGTGALRRVRHALSAWSWRPVWFLVGALAAMLAIEAPLVAMSAGILALLALPVGALLSASRTWANIAPPQVSAWPEPVKNQAGEGLWAA